MNNFPENSFPDDAELTKMFFTPKEDEPIAFEDRYKDIVDTIYESIAIKMNKDLLKVFLGLYLMTYKPYFICQESDNALVGYMFQIIAIGWELGKEGLKAHPGIYEAIIESYQRSNIISKEDQGQLRSMINTLLEFGVRSKE